MNGKRLVVCCDGTWKRSDDQLVSNIEKIARAIKTRAKDGRYQFVHYSNGVGTGATRIEKVLGGAFGLGLDQALLDAYRFLALNYEPGDEIYVFGFSRGAYTARSLVGMIDTVGLLTPEGLVGKDESKENRLRTALDLYRGRGEPANEAKIDSFRESHTYDSKTCPAKDRPRIRFLGVFDTVGAMGAPGLRKGKYKFHNVNLTSLIDVARQALAIDERRLTFDPCVWTKDPDKPNEITNVKQVWFDGVHSDIGGGLKCGALSEQTLAWMVGEAWDCGLDFDDGRLPAPHDCKGCRPDPYVPNKSMNFGYQVINVAKLGIRRLHRDPKVTPRNRGQWRMLEIVPDDGASPLLIAESSYRRWSESAERKKMAKNIGWWENAITEAEMQKRVVPIPPLAKPDDSSRLDQPGPNGVASQLEPITHP